MERKILVLMADLDADAQRRMSEWYAALREAGFTGTQTQGIPYHITLSTFSVDREQEASGIMKKAAAAFAPVEVHFSHIGLFAGGKVLFAAPERNTGLDALQAACESHDPKDYPWTPHATILIDEPENVYAALPVLMRSFTPFIGRLERLHLGSFWPAKEIETAELRGDERYGTF